MVNVCDVQVQAVLSGITGSGMVMNCKITCTVNDLQHLNKWRSRIELQAYFPQPMLQNVNFKFQPPTMFPFFVLANVVLLKVVHPLKIYQNTKFQGPTLTDASFTSTSKV
jgi:hypothetical protein